MLAVEGIDWSGSTNELNAAYSADGYARVGRRPGALVTTFGVGELSAINGIAGSSAEDVPVVHIAGMPSRASMERGAPLHHTFLDGDFLRFVRMFREVTAAQAVLDPRTAAQEIDRVLQVALNTSKPVYLGVPLDVANAPVLAEPLRIPLGCMVSEPAAVAEFRKALELRFAGETGITMLAGPRIHRWGLETRVAELAGLPGVRVASQPGSKALLDEDHPASLGTYLGATTRSDEAREAIDNASLLVMAGTVESDFTTGFFTQRYDTALAVELAVDHARIGRAVYPGVRLEDSMAVLHQLVAKSHFVDAGGVARKRLRSSQRATSTHLWTMNDSGHRCRSGFPRRRQWPPKPGRRFTGRSISGCHPSPTCSASRCGRPSDSPCRPCSAPRWPGPIGDRSSSSETVRRS